MRGVVALKALGRAFKLEFTVNGMCALEEQTGAPFQSFLTELQSAGDNFSLVKVRLLFWAGLQEHHEGLELREAGSIINALGGVEPAFRLIEKGLLAAMPDQPDGPPADADDPAIVGNGPAA